MFFGGRLSLVALAILTFAPPLEGAPGKGGPPKRSRPNAAPAPFTRAYLLDGQPFPKVTPFAPELPKPLRTFFVADSGPPGDGSQAHPWNDLQVALRSLRPGDRLRVKNGYYKGAFSIDAACQDGTEAAPIQVSFEKGVLQEKGDGPLLSVERAFWVLQRISLPLEEHNGPGLQISSHDVVVDNAFIYRGRGPGIRLAPGASRVTIANATILKIGLAQPGPDSLAIEIAPRTKEIRIIDCTMYKNPAGSVRVDASSGEPEASDVTLAGNSIHDDGGPALALLGGEKIRVADNTIFYGKQSASSRGIALENASSVEITGNHIADVAVAIRVGFADAKGGPFLRAHDITIARNAIETTYPKGTAIDVEAGRGVRVVNNVIEGYDVAITVFGSPPQTESVTVANNLVLSVSDVAFVLADAKAAAYFDHNVFSPRAESVDAEVGKKTDTLAKVLKDSKMPHTKIMKGVKLEHRDLGRVIGAATVDQGKAIEGISFKGSAPDIGVAEK